MVIFLLLTTLPKFFFFIHFRYCITEKFKLLADRNHFLLWQSQEKIKKQTIITIYLERKLLELLHSVAMKGNHCVSLRINIHLYLVSTTMQTELLDFFMKQHIQNYIKYEMNYFSCDRTMEMNRNSAMLQFKT